MFLICTIANNLPQYMEMKASFLQAGFDESRCRYHVFDNSLQNLHDPYKVINTVLAEASEPYVIFCHQDLMLDKGHGYEQLITQLNILSNIDTNWAIAGNAGCTEDLTLIVKIADPNCFQSYGELPQKVYSLDENFLVIRTASNLRCSLNLGGFHLYATDLCLQATKRGQSCYVIDFYLTHLSGGDTSSKDFQQSLVKFKQEWNQSFTFCLVCTPCTCFGLSRSRIFQHILRSGRITGWIRQYIGFYMRTAYTKMQFQRVMKLLSFKSEYID